VMAYSGGYESVGESAQNRKETIDRGIRERV
jgi:hypothetical protein